MAKIEKTNPIPIVKPTLPEKIETIDQGKAFLQLLDDAGWRYHPDADAVKVKFPEHNSPNLVERKRLNKLMDQCAQLAAYKIFDPWAWFYFGNMVEPKTLGE